MGKDVEGTDYGNNLLMSWNKDKANSTGLINFPRWVLGRRGSALAEISSSWARIKLAAWYRNSSLFVSQYIIIDLAIGRDCVQRVQPNDFEDDPYVSELCIVSTDK
jgi:hypothetical protein